MVNNGSRFAPRKKLAMPKVKRWSHQDELADLKGQEIIVRQLDSEPLRGTLIEADQFTLKIQPRSEISAVILFKSALTDFRKAL